jgi:hypothetical protein
MATAKVSVSLDAELLKLARGRARGSLSAYLNEALRRRVKNELLDDALSDWEREFGAIPDDVLAEAAAQWPD